MENLDYRALTLKCADELLANIDVIHRHDDETAERILSKCFFEMHLIAECHTHRRNTAFVDARDSAIFDAYHRVFWAICYEKCISPSIFVAMNKRAVDNADAVADIADDISDDIESAMFC